MTEPRQIATVRDYDGLIEALRARALEIGATREAIDEVGGLQKGYAAKVLAPSAVKGLGRMSMGPVLGALGLMLVVVEDVAAMAKYSSRLGIGQRAYMLNGVQNRPIILKFSRRHMRKLGKLSAAGRMKKMPKWKRSRVARQAAKARWRKPRVVEITAEPARSAARDPRNSRRTA